jgi:prepilin-type N-terminal cleavage/methylation domain-containing protein
MPSHCSDSTRRGFTLIELLVVVAVIAILAAIALPNFLEAQTRAKVSRVAADLRTIATAQESYRVDFNRYPPSLTLRHLTTPIAYLTSFPEDRFSTMDTRQDLQAGDPDRSYYEHVSENGDLMNLWADFHSYYPPFFSDRTGQNIAAPARWLYKSWGPTGIDHKTRRYDPTNGTVSEGDIARFGP